jgi:hypothetical protein
MEHVPPKWPSSKYLRAILETVEKGGYSSDMMHFEAQIYDIHGACKMI